MLVTTRRIPHPRGVARGGSLAAAQTITAAGDLFNPVYKPAN